MMNELIASLESTFRDDFTIADRWWKNGILDTYKRAFKHWHDDLVFITELSMVMNRKAWQRADKGNYEISKLYEKLWFETDTRCMDNLKGDDRKYYLRRTD